jgi:hypothetical protein
VWNKRNNSFHLQHSSIDTTSTPQISRHAPSQIHRIIEPADYPAAISSYTPGRLSKSFASRLAKQALIIPIRPENATGIARGLMTERPAAVAVVPTAPKIRRYFSRFCRDFSFWIARSVCTFGVGPGAGLEIGMRAFSGLGVGDLEVTWGVCGRDGVSFEAVGALRDSVWVHLALRTGC